MNSVQQAWHDASAKLYQQAQQAAGAGAGAGPGGPGGEKPGGNGGQSSEEVVDADFEVVDDK